MKRLTVLAAAMAVLVAGGAQWVSADIGTVTPAMTQIPPPPSVVFGVLESNDEIFVFEEQHNVTPAVVNVDIASPGSYTSMPPPVSLKPETTVCSHLIHFDPVGNGPAGAGGSVTFQSDVLGIIVSDGLLDGSDADLGLAGTAYPASTAARGSELGGGDTVTLSPDRRTVTVEYGASSPGDQARVVTECPKPRSEWVYTIKWVCGGLKGDKLHEATVAPGVYATDVNIANPNGQDADVRKRFTPIVGKGFETAREPDFGLERATDSIALPTLASTMDDCLRISELLYGVGAYGTLSSMPVNIGFLELRSNVELDVTAVYTTTSFETSGKQVPTIDVEQVEGRLLSS